ncbi:AraC family transcriptional regulator, partial [Rhodobacteraceae bacterium PA1-206B]
MNFRPNMTSVTSGIELAAPLIWRELPGVVADIWQVNVGRGSTGSYSAPDPRIVAVLDSGDSEMRLANGTSLRSQPVRIAFIPAGVPTRSGFRRSGRLAHLDVHFSAAELGARLRGT